MVTPLGLHRHRFPAPHHEVHHGRSGLEAVIAGETTDVVKEGLTHMQGSADQSTKASGIRAFHALPNALVSFNLGQLGDAQIKMNLSWLSGLYC